MAGAPGGPPELPCAQAFLRRPGRVPGVSSLGPVGGGDLSGRAAVSGTPPPRSGRRVVPQDRPPPRGAAPRCHRVTGQPPPVWTQPRKCSRPSGALLPGVPAQGAAGLRAGPPAQGAAARWRAFLESLLGPDSNEALCPGEHGRPQRGGSGAARVPPVPDSAAAPGAQGTLSPLRVALLQPQCPHR